MSRIFTVAMVHKVMVAILVGWVVITGWWIWREIYRRPVEANGAVTITIAPGESVRMIANRLESSGVIRHAWLFRVYAKWRDIDTKIQAGEFKVESPVTLAHVIESLAFGIQQKEKEITILPGWDLPDIGSYLEKEGVGTVAEFFALVGEPARVYDPPYAAVGKERVAPVFPSDARILADRPLTVSYEGYLAPETYRIFADATLSDIVTKLLDQRDHQFTEEIYAAIENSHRTVHEVLTVASIVEREVRSEEDRALVADIFWRRYDAGWLLQADSTVHYAVGKKGELFTTKADRESESPWNTYKRTGLPPGPISNPSLATIRAVVYSKKNDHWYFLTTLDGEVKYAKTLDEHNRNVAKYLR